MNEDIIDRSLLLTEAEIMNFERFREAVVIGGMPQGHYTKLCAMARACLEILEDDV